MDVLEEKHAEVAELDDTRGEACLKVKHYENALPFFRSSLNLRIAILGERHPDTSSSYYHLGQTYSYMGRFKKALLFF